MKILNFSCSPANKIYLEQVLPALLGKSKVQTIRPAWITGVSRYTASGTKGKEIKEELDIKTIEKPPRFKVADEVRILWNQRSKYTFFCSKCGIGNTGRIFLEEGCPKCGNEKAPFDKHLGNVEITEVFKIEMGRGVAPLLKGNILDYVKRLAKLDGFKSPKDMFNYFDKYDLSQPKEFHVYRWRWE